MNLDTFFHAKKIAVIGASREVGKVGYTIFRGLMGKKFELYPINPNAKEILGYKCYPSVLDVPNEIELAIIATPGATVPSILDEMGKKKIKHAIIISAGFKEIGNEKLEKELQEKLKSNKITCIGPNCLGIFDAHSGMDTLFLPKERLMRPSAGGISFISQSGATGSAILDLAAFEHYGFAKFISYGNATNVDETDLLEYLSKDPQTTVICMYVEGIKDGRRFLEVAKSCKKPIIAIKAGVSSEGGKAALSHTGSLAGSAEVVFGAFKQANVIIAHKMEELFEFAKMFEQVHTRASGKRVQIITNGGGYGILTTDAVVYYGLTLAQPGTAIKKLRSVFPPTVVVHNPIDVLGDATVERYKLAIEAAISDTNNDSIVVTILTQVPLVTTEIVDVVAKLYKKSHKPIVIVTTGSSYSLELKEKFEQNGLPCFTFPENAVRALAAYTQYCSF